MPTINLTQKFIDTISCPEGKAKIEYTDTQIQGFFVEVRANSIQHTYYQRVNMPNEGRRSLKVGRTSEMSLKDARTRAAKLKQDCLSGELDRQLNQQKASMSLDDFMQNYFYPHMSKHKRSKTVYAHKSLMKTHITGRLGKTPMNHIKSKDLLQIIDRLISLGRKAATVNKLISSVQQVIRYAIQLEHLTESDALKVKQLTDTSKKERYLTEAESRNLIQALDQWHVKPVALLIKFTYFTGARIGEVMKANWQDINLNDKTWKIPVENDKIKQGRTLPLNDTAVTILQEALTLRAEGQQEVFRSIQCKTAYKSVLNSWYKIRASIGLDDVRIHDLRHSFASHLVQNKVPLFEVSMLLGHRNIKTTTRYAHLDQETIRSSSKVMDRLIIAA